MTKKFKQVCQCEKCGNEAEMEITCSYVEYEAAVKKAADAEDKEEKKEAKVKGTGTCQSCGSEADMWVDL